MGWLYSVIQSWASNLYSNRESALFVFSSVLKYTEQSMLRGNIPYCWHSPPDKISKKLHKRFHSHVHLQHFDWSIEGGITLASLQPGASRG